MRLAFLALTASCATAEVRTVIVTPPPPLDEDLAFVPADPTPEPPQPEVSCGKEPRFRVGRVSLSNETVRRALADVRKPIRDAFCDCVHAGTAILAITPSKGAIEVTGIDDRASACVKARLVAPSFAPWSFRADCPTCGLRFGVFPSDPAYAPPPDGTLFAHVQFE